MGEAQMHRATDETKNSFAAMLNCLTDIELIRPFLVRESLQGKSYSELAIKYDLTKAIVRHQIKCAKNCHSKSKEPISE